MQNYLARLGSDFSGPSRCGYPEFNGLSYYTCRHNPVIWYVRVVTLEFSHTSYH